MLRVVVAPGVSRLGVRWPPLCTVTGPAPAALIIAPLVPVAVPLIASEPVPRAAPEVLLTTSRLPALTVAAPV